MQVARGGWQVRPGRTGVSLSENKGKKQNERPRLALPPPLSVSRPQKFSMKLKKLEVDLRYNTYHCVTENYTAVSASKEDVRGSIQGRQRFGGGGDGCFVVGNIGVFCSQDVLNFHVLKSHARFQPFSLFSLPATRDHES